MMSECYKGDVILLVQHAQHMAAHTVIHDFLFMYNNRYIPVKMMSYSVSEAALPFDVMLNDAVHVAHVMRCHVPTEWNERS